MHNDIHGTHGAYLWTLTCCGHQQCMNTKQQWQLSIISSYEGHSITQKHILKATSTVKQVKVFKRSEFLNKLQFSSRQRFV